MFAFAFPELSGMAIGVLRLPAVLEVLAKTLLVVVVSQTPRP